MGDTLEKRRGRTQERLAELKGALAKAEEVASGKAAVYATGSFGRHEASEHSDLDLFIVGEKELDGDKPALRNLDAICLKAELIQVTRDKKLPEFDGDGRWLQQYTVDDLIRTLGRPEDDVTNTFTARLLLLLESEPLVGEAVYDECIARVLGKYWRDYEDHQDSFMPAFLANDILRLWRTFCINYEARTETDPAEKKAKRKLKNYKLKHSRLLTCYSALAYMLAKFSKAKTFSPLEAKTMVKLTPTGRIEALLDDADLSDAHPSLRLVVQRYERFLDVTARSTEELVKDFLRREFARERAAEAVELGDAMLKVLEALRDGQGFYRLLVV